jgi:hypothetical protein
MSRPEKILATFEIFVFILSFANIVLPLCRIVGKNLSSCALLLRFTNFRIFSWAISYGKIVCSQNVKINILNVKINVFFYFTPRQRRRGSPNGQQGAEH